MLKKLSSFLVIVIAVSFHSQAQNIELLKNSISKPRTTVSKSSIVAADHSGQNHDAADKCGQHSKTEELMALNPSYREGVLASIAETERIIAEMESGDRATPPIYTIPVVFHVIHKGESVGTGTNISTAQLQSAIDALNRDYRRTNADGGIGQGAGPDTEIQFCLAGVDPNGNPHSGINRVSGTGVSGYSSSGITSSNESSVKALSRWDNRYYLNIWVVSEIEGNGADISNTNNFTGGTLGYAYLPSTPVTANANLDGIVALNLCVGNDPNGSNGYRLWFATRNNRTLTHEVGHFLGLNHTFSDSNPFTCSNGDGIADTPNAKQVNLSSCTTSGACTGQMIENYMDYTPEECQNRFTSGQNTVMRGVLAGTRNALVNTNNCGSITSNDYDAGISQVNTPNGALCSTTFTPSVTLYNYGNTTLTSVQIQYYVDAQTPTTYNWSGSLASNASTTVNLNSVTTTAGAHTFTARTVSGSLNGSNGDQDTGNDQSTSSFNVGTGGSGVTITIELDCWGTETTWEIRNSSNSVVASGGAYTNNLPGGAGTQVETACLPAGCYDFTIFDSEGDGLNGSFWTTCNVDGDYSIVDENNATLIQMLAADGAFNDFETQNFCVGGGNQGGTSCENLAEFFGQGFYINENDEPTFEAQIIDNDQQALATALANAGYSSNWMLGFYTSTAPGDTNWFIGSTSWHANTSAPADNWLTFGPVTMLDDDGELRWKHQFADNDYRDGYEVLVGTSGVDVADFNSATTLFSVADNAASTDGDTVWTQFSVPLPAGTYANQSLYFAFHHDALDMFLLFLDEIEVEGCTSITVGTNDAEELDMMVYPNPSNGNFTLSYRSQISEQLDFVMLNAVGQVVWNGTSDGRNSGVKVIETDGLAAGVYTLVVRSESFSSSERLILSK
ncbi:MAG: hypothetical protein RL266_2001 [Bacteroidota bacterium]